MKKGILILILLILALFSLSCIYAADVNDTAIASEDDSQIELSMGDEVTKDNLQANNEETVSAETDSEILTDGQYTYSNLREQIGSGGNINLTKGTYTYYGGDGDTIQIRTPGVINGNGAVIDMEKASPYTQAFFVAASDVTIQNLTIKNSCYWGNGAAIHFQKSGTVINCNFTNNQAMVDQYWSSFDGGAIFFQDSGTVTNCYFINNEAAWGNGGAIYFTHTGTVTNCYFANNYVGAIYSHGYTATADTCIFKTYSDSTFQVTILPPTLNFDNFTTSYGSNEKLTFDLKTNSSIPVSNGNISISVYFKDNNSWFGNYSCLSGEGWTVDLPVGSYYAIFNTEYAGFQPINRTITVNKAKTVLVADAIITTHSINKDLVITLKDVNNNLLSGFVIFVDWNGTKNYTTDGNGQVKIPTKGLAANIYEVLITFNGTESYVNSSNTTTVSIYKESSRVDTKPLTTDYNVHKYLVVGLKDNEGNPIRNADAYIVINGVTYKCRSDDKGNARLIIRLNPGTYTAKITFDNVNYTGFTQYVTVIVKKATPKLAAKNKKFKKSKKVKKYTVTLKSNVGKAMKKVKVTLKVKGKKAITVKTNNKGKATFKIKKLTKKGKYKATVTYKGNKNYNKVTKKVKITIK